MSHAASPDDRPLARPGRASSQAKAPSTGTCSCAIPAGHRPDARAQQRLAPFPGLHMTPLERLHMTTLLAGPTIGFSREQLQQMIQIATGHLADIPPITVTVGRHPVPPEAIMLAVKPARALMPVHKRREAATQAVTGATIRTRLRPMDTPHHDLLQHRRPGHGTSLIALWDRCPAE